MCRFILGLPGNIQESIFRTTWELNEDITALLLLISTDDHMGVDQDVIHNSEGNYDDDATIFDINESDSGYKAEKQSADNILADEEVKNMEDSWK